MRIYYFLIFIVLTSISACNRSTEKNQEKKTNIVIIFTDDQGYSDVGAFGATGYETPNLDKMVSEGRKFTNFYVGSSVCSPSRASLLTGCYPARMGINFVFAPKGPDWTLDKYNLGLNPKETTLAELLKQKNYTSACIGKWHLGHAEEFLPTNQGFDYFWGIPYSNDMIPETDSLYPDLPLMHNLAVIDKNPDQSLLTKRFTDKATEFIAQNKNEPFFLYLAHPMPHVPLHTSSEFSGITQEGLYADVIREIDWSVGRIIDELEKHNLTENTLVIFSSDNGPWLVKGEDAGDNGPFREGKMTVFEGGFRVPFIARWPGTIPSGTTSDEIITALDILPTVAEITDVNLPKRKIDGLNLLSAFTNSGGQQRKEFYYYFGGKALAIRHDNWKLVMPHNYRSYEENPSSKGYYMESNKSISLSLFDLENDKAESINLANERPEITAKLQKRILTFDSLMNLEARDVGRSQGFQ